MLREFRAQGSAAAPVVIGSHRKPEAVLVPYSSVVPAPGDSATTEGRPGTPLRELLHHRRSLIERLARANRIRSVEVFGSAARGDDRPDSDVDLLVVPNDDASLFDLAQFEVDVASLLERTVDVVSRGALDPIRDRGILDEAQAL
ncbi:nucleotidyltransferase family protein [Agromyces rhizosphaerae]|uniref:nucleotidyltransferase family protein n=1 Tax=Agromyces rhizosphaerae TaxID=88374 RepID=UPI002493BFE3|nr:nucleotidyltransferase domain-containing protein [Agromyces rhizosphaerae]